MKRILAITLTLVMALAALTGCMGSQNSFGKEVQSGIPMTIAETLPSCVAFEYKSEKPYCFYAYDAEGKLYRVLWADFTGLNEKDVIIVDYNDKIRKLNDVNSSGWTPQYEITATGVKMEKRANENLVGHIQISSGIHTIMPFGCLLWSKIDNKNGTFTETKVDKYDVVDLVSGKTSVPVTDIPTLVLDKSVSYAVQVNGRVENVFLLSQNGNGYAKTETKFSALSSLSDGTYYVVFEVLLSGNCDPDAPQNSYRYEDVFRLTVGNQEEQPFHSSEHFHDHVPYDAMLNLEVMDGLFTFQRIATTPCIVYSHTPITDMTNGTEYDGRHDILTTIFKAMDGKKAIMDTSECEFSHYIYMFDNEREDIPWHYRFAICDCGAVMITNHDEFMCTIRISEEEMQSVLNALK